MPTRSALIGLSGVIEQHTS
ncbi:hypothetical protein [Enhygromyxa salina]